MPDEQLRPDLAEGAADRPAAGAAEVPQGAWQASWAAPWPGAWQSGWQGGWTAPVAGPPAPARGITAGVAFGIAGVLALALVVAALVVAVVLRSGADDLGRGLGTALGESSAQAYGGITLSEDEAWGAHPPAEDVQQFDPVAPGRLGPDPVLDAYAQQCFTGDLQSCDDLMSESPPLSDYEEYAGTCGGRVKAGQLFACTDLD